MQKKDINYILTERISRLKKEVSDLKTENKVLKSEIEENKKIVLCKDQTIKVLKENIDSLTNLYKECLEETKRSQEIYKNASREALLIKDKYSKEINSILKKFKQENDFAKHSD